MKYKALYTFTLLRSFGKAGTRDKRVLPWPGHRGMLHSGLLGSPLSTADYARARCTWGCLASAAWKVFSQLLDKYSVFRSYANVHFACMVFSLANKYFSHTVIL